MVDRAHKTPENLFLAGARYAMGGYMWLANKQQDTLTKGWMEQCEGVADGAATCREGEAQGVA